MQERSRWDDTWTMRARAALGLQGEKYPPEWSRAATLASGHAVKLVPSRVPGQRSGSGQRLWIQCLECGQWLDTGHFDQHMNRKSCRSWGVCQRHEDCRANPKLGRACLLERGPTSLKERRTGRDKVMRRRRDPVFVAGGGAANTNAKRVPAGAKKYRVHQAKGGKKIVIVIGTGRDPNGNKHMTNYRKKYSKARFKGRLECGECGRTGFLTTRGLHKHIVRRHQRPVARQSKKAGGLLASFMKPATRAMHSSHMDIREATKKARSYLERIGAAFQIVSTERTSNAWGTGKSGFLVKYEDFEAESDSELLVTPEGKVLTYVTASGMRRKYQPARDWPGHYRAHRKAALKGWRRRRARARRGRC